MYINIKDIKRKDPILELINHVDNLPYISIRHEDYITIRNCVIAAVRRTFFNLK